MRDASMLRHGPASTRTSQARTVGGIRVEQKRFGPDAELAWHRHRGAYGCVVVTGAAQEQFGSAMHTLERTETSLRPPGIRHRARFGPKGATVVAFEVDADRFQSLSDGSWKCDGLLRRRSAPLTVLARKAVTELRQTDDFSSLVLEGIVLEWLGEMFRLRPIYTDGIPAWLRRVRDRLHDEPERRLTHEELAREAAVHPVHLARAFRRFFGQPPAAYQRRLRLERAAQRLETTAEPISQIAQANGYCDQAHFSNAFKRAFGLTPLAYRRSHSR